MRNMKTVPYEGMFTLSAPSPKWAWNAQGQLVEVPAGQPAWAYDPVTSQSLGQRVEAVEATTSITQSSDFSGAPWTATRMTVDPASGIGPDGEMSMTKLIPTTDDATHILRVSSSGGALKTVTIFARSMGYRYFTLARSSGSYNVCFDLVDGVVASAPANTLGGATVSDLDATIKHVGNGIYRCSYTQGQASILDIVVNQALATGAAESFAGDGVSGIEVFGINETDGTEISSYIEATGTAQIRSADILDVADIAPGVDRGSILIRCQLTEGAPVLSFDGTALVAAPDAETHTYVISYDDTETLISIDGADATTGAGITPSLPLNVFRDSSSAGNGYIEDLVFSPIKKTAAQVKAASAEGEL